MYYTIIGLGATIYTFTSHDEALDFVDANNDLFGDRILITSRKCNK